MMAAFDKLIDWDRADLFSNNRPNFHMKLKAVLDSHGNQSKHALGLPGVLFYLDPKAALGLTDPISRDSEDRIEVRPLEECHAEILVKNWKFAESHSRNAIAACIRTMESIGVFINGDLASSAILSPLGKINILYTEEAHRRKGLGEVTMVALAKAIARMGVIPAAEVEAGNDKSMRLMEKVGFKRINDVMWYYYEK
jgi:GNAT superfamily N-acetyltransferase